MPFDPYAYDLRRSAAAPALPAAGGAAVALPPLSPDALQTLWHGLMHAVEGTLALWERTPAGAKHELPVFSVQHVGQPLFDPAWLRAQSQTTWHRLMGIEARLAAQALEALILEDTREHQEMLAEECARIAQLHQEMTRSAGEEIALPILRFELRMLRYRASPVLALLIFG
jgi:hypothetical protein